MTRKTAPSATQTEFGDASLSKEGGTFAPGLRSILLPLVEYPLLTELPTPSGNIKDYYYILGVTRQASKDEIKKACRKLTIKLHPDQNNGDNFFEERFKDILAACDTLSNDTRRKICDEKLEDGNAAPTTPPSPPG